VNSTDTVFTGTTILISTLTTSLLSLYEPYELAIVGHVLLIVEYRLYRRPNEGYFFSSILKSNNRAFSERCPALTERPGRFSTEGLNSLPAGSKGFTGKSVYENNTIF
jgi:hypothetical protein